MKTLGILSGLFMILMIWSCSDKTGPTALPPKAEVEAPPRPEREEPVEVVSPESKAETVEVEKVMLIARIKKTPCFGKCPVFEAILFSDGTATYKGKRNVEKVGEYEAKASLELIKLIQEKAAAISYFDFEKTYPANGKMIKDIPNTVTEINKNGQKKQITNNHNAPQELQDFEKYLLTTFDSLNWKKVQGDN
jgi:hypothetical protein